MSHCDCRHLSLEDVFDLCCVAFAQCQAALEARDHTAFMEAREIHNAYADLHSHLMSGGTIH